MAPKPSSASEWDGRVPGFGETPSPGWYDHVARLLHKQAERRRRLGRFAESWGSMSTDTAAARRANFYRRDGGEPDFGDSDRTAATPAARHQLEHKLHKLHKVKGNYHRAIRCHQLQNIA